MGISTVEQLRFKRRTSHVPVNFQSPHFAVQSVRVYINVQVSFHYEWPSIPKFSSKCMLTRLGPDTFPYFPVKLHVVKCTAQCTLFFSFVAEEHESPLERKSESFFTIWEIPVHFEDVLKSLQTSIPSEHLPKVLQSECFLSIATLMKMSNMLYIKVEQVEISQASEGHLDQVSRTRSHVFAHQQATQSVCKQQVITVCATDIVLW